MGAFVTLRPRPLMPRFAVVTRSLTDVERLAASAFAFRIGLRVQAAAVKLCLSHLMYIYLPYLQPS